MTIDDVMRTGPVIAVIVLEDAADAEPLGRALLKGGVRVLEVTLRTDAALEGLARMAALPGAIAGAGTVTRAAQVEAVAAAGGAFCVSPGFSPAVAEAARAHAIPWLPGVVTPGEVMTARDAGLSALKFFPAEPMNGEAVLKAYASVFPDVTFCPTGGLTAESARHYLALPNVPCIGGSWLVAADLVKRREWAAVTEHARACAALPRHARFAGAR